MENRVSESWQSSPQQPAAAQREEEQRGLQTWGLYKRRSLGAFLWVQSNRQGQGQAGLRREGQQVRGAGSAPGRAFPSFPRLLQTPAERQLLSGAVGLSVPCGGLYTECDPLGDILLHPPFVTTQLRG